MFQVLGTMAVIALTIYIAFGVLALGGRLWMQRQRTGSTGYRGISSRLGTVGLAGGISFTEARRHVREEVPFFAGPRVSVDRLVAELP